MILITILTEITEATGHYCQTSLALYFAHIWVTVGTTLSTGVAIFSVLRFYSKCLKASVGQRKPMAKLIAFKAIVFLTWLQNVSAPLRLPSRSDHIASDPVEQTIFGFLMSSDDLKPTSIMTYKDLTVVLPNLILSFEMVIFATVFLFVFRTREYNFKKGAASVPLGHGGYHGGFLGLRAIFSALNIIDIFQAIGNSVSSFAGQKQQRSWPQKTYGGGRQEVSADYY
jgi:hypothetical protein